IGSPLEHLGEVRGAVFSGDDTRALTWGEDNTARLWDAATGLAIRPPLEHLSEVRGAVFSGDDTRALTWGEDNTARLWDTATGLAIGPPVERRYWPSGAVFAGHGRRVWDGGADLDLPSEVVVLQARAITGTELVPQNRETKTIEPRRWRQIRDDWEDSGRSHYRVCQYPRYNLWRRFHIEEAEEIRSLK
ncbi:MAG: hypothetical protein GY719_24365, partial [bacterium]|nr:hypothetical protein [bacterium]